MTNLEYVTQGIYGHAAKRQLHLDVPDLLRRQEFPDTPAYRRLAIREAFAELRGYGFHKFGTVLIARQAGVTVQ